MSGEKKDKISMNSVYLELFRKRKNELLAAEIKTDDIGIAPVGGKAGVSIFLDTFRIRKNKLLAAELNISEDTASSGDGSEISVGQQELPTPGEAVPEPVATESGGTAEAAEESGMDGTASDVISVSEGRNTSEKADADQETADKPSDIGVANGVAATAETDDNEVQETVAEQTGEADETDEADSMGKTSGDAEEADEEETGDAEEADEEETGDAEEAEEEETGDAEEAEEEETGDAETADEEEPGDAETADEEETGDAEEADEEETGDAETADEEETGDAETVDEEETGDAEAAEEGKAVSDSKKSRSGGHGRRELPAKFTIALSALTVLVCGAILLSGRSKDTESILNADYRATIPTISFTDQTSGSKPQESTTASSSTTETTSSSAAESKADTTTSTTKKFKIKSLRPGLENDDVMRMQKRLAELGYISEQSCTGYYGEYTQKWLKVFQANAGLEETGIADVKTLKRLYADDAPKR